MTHPGAQYLAELEASAKEATQGEWQRYYDDYSICNESGHICSAEFSVDAAHIANASPARIAAIAEAFASEKARADAAEAQSAARKTMIEGLELLVKDAEEKITIMEGMGIDQMLSDRPVYSRRQIIERAEQAEATIARLREGEARLSLQLNETAARDSATIASLTEQLAEARGALKPFAEAAENADRGAVQMGFAPSFDEYVRQWSFSYGDLRRARATLSRLEKQEGEA